MFHRIRDICVNNRSSSSVVNGLKNFSTGALNWGVCAEVNWNCMPSCQLDDFARLTRAVFSVPLSQRMTWTCVPFSFHSWSNSHVASIMALLVATNNVVAIPLYSLIRATQTLFRTGLLPAFRRVDTSRWTNAFASLDLTWELVWRRLTPFFLGFSASTAFTRNKRCHNVDVDRVKRIDGAKVIVILRHNSTLTASNFFFEVQMIEGALGGILS